MIVEANADPSEIVDNDFKREKEGPSGSLSVQPQGMSGELIGLLGSSTVIADLSYYTYIVCSIPIKLVCCLF